MTPVINRDILLQTLRGYSEVNRITEAERQAHLAHLTSTEAWAEFKSLYAIWLQTGRQAGGDWAALSERKLEEALVLRKAFATLAQRKGLI